MSFYTVYGAGFNLKFNTFEDASRHIIRNWSIWKITWGIVNPYCFMIPKKNVDGKWIRTYVYIKGSKRYRFTEEEFLRFGTDEKYRQKFV